MQPLLRAHTIGLSAAFIDALYIYRLGVFGYYKQARVFAFLRREIQRDPLPPPAPLFGARLRRCSKFHKTLTPTDQTPSIQEPHGERYIALEPAV